MFKRFADILSRITDWRVIAAFLVLAILILFFPWRFAPDWFHLGRLTGKKEILFRLLTTIIGSSGVMLTLLLVGYNFYVKTTRRFTLDFVADNPFLRIIVSLYFGLATFVSSGFFFVETLPSVNNTTILYFSYFLSIGFLLCLFPLSLLAISESNSLRKVYKVLDSITDEDLDKLYQSEFIEGQAIDGLERNPVLVVRDLCVAAVSDKDWVLPQSVLDKLFTRLILGLRSNSKPFEVQRGIFIWNLIANRLKSEVIKNGDQATAHTLFFQAIKAHEHFAGQGILHLRGNQIDEFLISYLRQIIEANAFHSIQSYASRYLCDIVRGHFAAFRYTDQQAPTMDFMLKSKSLADENLYKTTAIRDYWLYLTQEITSLLVETLECGIDHRRKSIYGPAFWNLQFLMDEVYRSECLTLSQKRDALKELLYRTRNLSDYAIDHKVFDRVEPVSHVQIGLWLQRDSLIGWDGLYSYKEMLKRLCEEKVEVSHYLDRFFMVARSISHSADGDVLMNEVVEYILKETLGLFNRHVANLPLRQQILYQSKWFYEEYLEKNEKLGTVKEKLGARISAMLLEHAELIPKYA